MEIAESATERSLGRNEPAVLFEPDSKFFDDGFAELLSPCTPHFGGVAGEGGIALNLEQRCHEVQAVACDGIAESRSFDEAAACVGHATRALATGALDAVGDAGAIALHGAREIIAEEIANALPVSVCGKEEAHPARVGPGPDGAGADAFGGTRIEHWNAGGVGAEVTRGAGHGGNESSHRHEQVDVRGDSTPEGLRRDGEARACEPQALSLDRLVLQELVGRGLDDQGIAQLAALNDRGRGRSGDDGVVVWAGNGFVDSALDEEARGNNVDCFAHRVRHGLHLRTAERADSQVIGDRVGYVHAGHVRGKRAAPTATAPLFLFARRVRFRARVFLCSRGRSQAHQREHELAPEPLECFGTRALARQMSHPLGELEIDRAHARDQRDHAGDQLDKLERGHLLLEPATELFEIRRVRRSRRLLHPTR